jgi:hypothetical protein
VQTWEGSPRSACARAIRKVADAREGPTLDEQGKDYGATAIAVIAKALLCMSFRRDTHPTREGSKKTGFVARAPKPSTRFSRQNFLVLWRLDRAITPQDK